MATELALSPLEDARRYLTNAKALLSEKANKEGGFYTDKKYVKLAGHAAYTGVLLALDALFEKKTKGRKSVDWYIENIAKTDRKLLTTFNVAYDTLHLAMGYDGNQDAEVVASGLKRATSIIDWVESRMAA